MILDAGVLISIDRREEAANALIRHLDRDGVVPHTTEPVVAQVWRNGVRQARLARTLQDVRIHPFSDGRAVGQLVGDAGTRDVVDAHLVLLAFHLREPVVTSDPDDLRRLADVLGAAAPAIYAWP